MGLKLWGPDGVVLGNPERKRAAVAKEKCERSKGQEEGLRAVAGTDPPR